MPIQRRAIGELIAMGLIAALVAFGLAYATGRATSTSTSKSVDPTRLEAKSATFHFHQGAGRFTVSARDGAFARDVELSLVVDGSPRPISIAREEIRRTSGEGFHAVFPVAVGEQIAERSAQIGREDAAGGERLHGARGGDPHRVVRLRRVVDDGHDRERPLGRHDAEWMRIGFDDE